MLNTSNSHDYCSLAAIEKNYTQLSSPEQQPEQIANYRTPIVYGPLNLPIRALTYFEIMTMTELYLPHFLIQLPLNEVLLHCPQLFNCP